MVIAFRARSDPQPSPRRHAKLDLRHRPPSPIWAHDSGDHRTTVRGLSYAERKLGDAATFTNRLVFCRFRVFNSVRIPLGTLSVVNSGPMAAAPSTRYRRPSSFVPVGVKRSGPSNSASSALRPSVTLRPKS